MGQEVVLPRVSHRNNLNTSACGQFKFTRPAGLGKTHALKQCPGGGNRKAIQNKEDLQEANFERLFNTHCFFFFFFLKAHEKMLHIATYSVQFSCSVVSNSL